MWSKAKNIPAKLALPAEPTIFLKLAITKTDYYEAEVKWLLRILNFSGNCPLSSYPAGQESCLKRRYGFKWKSVPTVICGIGAFVAICSWLVYVFQIVMRKDVLPEWLWLPRKDLTQTFVNDPSLSKSVKKATRIALAAAFGMIPLFQILDLGATWNQTLKLKDFLNNWCYFEGDFRSVFYVTECPLVAEFISKPFRKLTTFLIYASVLGPALAGIIFLYSGQSQHTWFQCFLLFYLSFRLNSVELGLDGLSILGFKMITDAFLKIRQRIELELKLSTPTKEKVVQWRRLLQTTREQCHLLAQSQSPIQMHFIARCFLIVTLFFFIALNIPPRENDVYILQFHIQWGLFGCLQIVRMLLKTMQAEKITKEEAKIAKILSTVDTTELDDATIMQLKFGYDTITQNPCIIKFANVVFDNGLVLEILGQVATYLIVLIQFVQD